MKLSICQKFEKFYLWTDGRKISWDFNVLELERIRRLKQPFNQLKPRKKSIKLRYKVKHKCIHKKERIKERML